MDITTQTGKDKVQEVGMSQFLDKMLLDLQHYSGHHPEAEFVVDFVTRYRGNGELSDDEIYHQVVTHLIAHGRSTYAAAISGFNKQVYEGIEKLAVNGEWPNLVDIAKHAYGRCLSIMEKEKVDALVSRTFRGGQFRNAILNAGEDEFIGIIAEYFTEKGQAAQLIDELSKSAV